MDNLIHEECGVFGIFSPVRTDLAYTVYHGLFALQHRGQESCGIVVNDNGVFTHHKDLGLVPEVFGHNNIEKLGQGNIAIGHVRYSTTGNCTRTNAQPLVVRHVKGPLAVAHNGNLVNAHILREKYELKGAIFHSTNDTEVISYEITNHRLEQPSIEAAVEKTVSELSGAFSLVVMSPQKLIAVRDPDGFRPLCIGKCDDGSVVFASESCALDSIGAHFVRDVEPGEMVIVDHNGMRSVKTHCGKKGTLCVFEYVYFARPDSVIDGQNVHMARLNAGKVLWDEHPVDADIVVGVPDSGIDAAIGLSKASGIPYGVGFVKNRYIGRTFIQPSQAQRTNSVKIKLNVIKDVVKDKRVILVDDSIVRGTTCRRIVDLVREAGAKEVHMRISSPPFTNPCYFGVDIDSKENLIACNMTIDEIAEHIGADSLGYISVEGVKSIAPESSCGFCTACFDGKYPVEVPDEMPKDKFESRIGE